MHVTFTFGSANNTEYKPPLTKEDWQECEIVLANSKLTNNKEGPFQLAREIRIFFRGFSWTGDISFLREGISEFRYSSSNAILDKHNSPSNILTVKLYPVMLTH